MANTPQPGKKPLQYETVCGLWRCQDRDGRVYFKGRSKPLGRIFIVRPVLIQRPNGPEYEIRMSEKLEESP